MQSSNAECHRAAYNEIDTRAKHNNTNNNIHHDKRKQTNMRAFPAMTNVANAELRLVFLSLMTGHAPFLQYVHARGVLK